MRMARTVGRVFAAAVGVVFAAGCTPDTSSSVQADVENVGTQESALLSTSKTGSTLSPTINYNYTLLQCSGSTPYKNLEGTACVSQCGEGQELYNDRCYQECPADTFQSGQACYPDGYGGTIECPADKPIRYGTYCCTSTAPDKVCFPILPLSGFSLSVPPCYYPTPYWVCNAWGSCWCQSTKPY